MDILYVNLENETEVEKNKKAKMNIRNVNTMDRDKNHPSPHT